MTQKPKTKAIPKTKTKFTDKEQSERFIETARKLGVEETGDAFERATAAILKPRRQVPS